MNKTWIQVVIAAVFEVCWVVGLKHANTTLEWIGTGIAIFISFYILISASKRLPVGTVYAVFVGLGTLGTVITDIVLFDQPVLLMKMVFIAILLFGVVGLKALTPHEEDAK